MNSKTDKFTLLYNVGITILNQRIIYKDDIEFVTEFPCLLGLPASYLCAEILNDKSAFSQATIVFEK